MMAFASFESAPRKRAGSTVLFRGMTMAHRVLVVDDDQAIHALARESLSNWFTHCIGAFDGETAVRFASVQKPDAILLDIIRPGWNGSEVCPKLRGNARPRETPGL